MSKGKGRAWGFSWLNLPILLAAWWLPYLVQMKVAQAKPKINWADPSDPQKLLNHFLRKIYGTFSINASAEENDERAGRGHASIYFVSLLRSQFPLPQPFLALLGLDGALMQGHMVRGLLFLGLAVMYGPVFAMIGNQPHQLFFMDLLERFYSNSMYGWSGLLAIGIYCGRSKLRGIGKLGFTLAVFCLPLISLANNFERASQRGQCQAYDFTRLQMDLMPPNSVFLCLGDLNCGVADYITLVEHLYPKMVVVLPGLIVSDWYTQSLPEEIGQSAQRVPGDHVAKLNAMMAYCHQQKIPVTTNYYQEGLEGEFVDMGMYYRVLPKGSARPGEAEYYKMLAEVLDRMLAYPIRGDMRSSLKTCFWQSYFLDEWARAFGNLTGLLQKRDPVRARKALSRVLEIRETPTTTDWLNHALLSLALKDYKQAEYDCLQVLKGESNNIYATALLYDVCQQRGERTQARIWQRRLVELQRAQSTPSVR